MSTTLIPNQSGPRVYIQTEAGVCIAGEAIHIIEPRYFIHGDFYAIQLSGPGCDAAAGYITQDYINRGDSYETDELSTEVVKAIALASAGRLSDKAVISFEDCVDYAQKRLAEKYADDEVIEVVQ